MISRILDILNDLRPKQIFMLAGGATILMFVFAYFTLYLLVPKEEPVSSAKPEVEMRNVVVAKSDIAAKTVINENMVQIKQVPLDLVPLGALTELRSVVGRSAGVGMYVGDVVTEQKVRNMESIQSKFTDSIPVDCRAVSVGVGSVTGVAGFAKAGDYVDVILVQKDNHSAVSSLLLQNVLLLSINKNAGGGENSMEEMTEETRQGNITASEDPVIATLALRPKEVMELVSAAALGEIYLSLRPSRPKETHVNQPDYTMYSIAKPVAAPATAPAPVVAAPVAPVWDPAEETVSEPEAPASSGIEIIQGDKIMQK